MVDLFRAPASKINFKDIEEFYEEKNRESEILDYKRQFSESVLETVTAFANREGGIMLIGIVEEGGVPTEIVGVIGKDLDSIELQYTNRIRNRIIPQPRFDVIPAQFQRDGEDRFVILIRVPKSPAAPHSFNDVVYIRRGNQSVPADLYAIEQLLKQREQLSEAPASKINLLEDMLRYHREEGLFLSSDEEYRTAYYVLLIPHLPSKELIQFTRETDEIIKEKLDWVIGIGGYDVTSSQNSCIIHNSVKTRFAEVDGDGGIKTIYLRKEADINPNIISKLGARSFDSALDIYKEYGYYGEITARFGIDEISSSPTTNSRKRNLALPSNRSFTIPPRPIQLPLILDKTLAFSDEPTDLAKELLNRVLRSSGIRVGEGVLRKWIRDQSEKWTTEC